MSYSYLRHKAWHEGFCYQLRNFDFSRLDIEFEYFLWPNYSNTIKFFSADRSSEELSIDAVLVDGRMTLREFRDQYIEEQEAARNQFYSREKFFEDVMDELPHGSGIDADWTLGEVTDTHVTFCNSYHTMDEWGGYDGWIDFDVTYEYDYAARTVKNPVVSSPETEWIREYENDEEELVEIDDLPGHLEYLDSEFEDIKL